MVSFSSPVPRRQVLASTAASAVWSPLSMAKLAEQSSKTTRLNRVSEARDPLFYVDTAAATIVNGGSNNDVAFCKDQYEWDPAPDQREDFFAAVRARIKHPDLGKHAQIELTRPVRNSDLKRVEASQKEIEIKERRYQERPKSNPHDLRMELLDKLHLRRPRRLRTMLQE